MEKYLFTYSHFQMRAYFYSQTLPSLPFPFIQCSVTCDGLTCSLTSCGHKPIIRPPDIRQNLDAHLHVVGGEDRRRLHLDGHILLLLLLVLPLLPLLLLLLPLHPVRICFIRSPGASQICLIFYLKILDAPV